MQNKKPNRPHRSLTYLSLFLCLNLLLLAAACLKDSGLESMLLSGPLFFTQSTPTMKGSGSSIQYMDSSQKITQTIEKDAADVSTNPESLSLYTRHDSENESFYLDNMFPGDAETKNYRVLISYQGNITLHFKAEMDPTKDGLKDFLKCRISLPDSGTLLYDGLLKDMPDSLNTVFETDTPVQREVLYEVRFYLDASAGNEAMNQDLKADLIWWVEETQNLTSPDTGLFSEFPIGLLACALLFAAALIIFLKRKGGARHEI